MSIFTKLNGYITEKRLQKLERDLHMIENRARFEPKYSMLSKTAFSADKFTRKISEYMAWSTGDVDIIREFFSGGGHLGKDSQTSLNLFWEVAPQNSRFIHLGIPALINTTMSKILFGKGINIDVTVYKKNADGTMSDKIDEAESNRISSMLDTLLDETNAHETLIRSAAQSSWGGHVFFKLNYDTDILPYPILENVDIRSGEAIYERGIATRVVFHTWYERKETNKVRKFRLDEIYRTVRVSDQVAYKDESGDIIREIKVPSLRGEPGDAMIEYRLFELLPNGDEREVPANAIPETQDILEPIVVFKGLKGMLAFELSNRLPNNAFPDSNYGASDFANSTTAFDALDEVASELARETRDNKSLRLFPASLLPKDENGRIKGPQAFVTNIVKYEGSMAEGSKNEILTQELKDKTDSLIEKYKQAIATACNNAGLSPLALGITGLEAINAGENSQRERNKVTLETRDLKIKTFQPKLEKIFLKVLELNTWMQKNIPGLQQPGIEAMDIDFSNCNVKVSFPDYLQSSDQENITTWGNAKMQRVADTQTAVEKIYRDLTKEDQMAIVNRIRFEEGMAIDNPEALRLDDLLEPDDPAQE